MSSSKKNYTRMTGSDGDRAGTRLVGSDGRTGVMADFVLRRVQNDSNRNQLV